MVVAAAAERVAVAHPAYDESEASFGGDSFEDSHSDSRSGPPAAKRESVGHGGPAPNDDLPF